MNKQTFITILLTALTSMSMYAYDFKKDGICYNIEGDHVSVTNNSGSVYQGSIMIPNEVTYNGVTYPVTSIAEHAFDGGRDITYLFIPRCITNIGENAFFNCGSINEVRIDYLSAWCKVYFGNEYSCPLSCAERLSFSYNPYDKVKSLFIPDDVESIPNFAFYRCRSITSLFIPSSVKKIGSSAFEECTGLTAVEIAEGVEKIGGSSFEGCTGLSTIVFPSSVKSIALNAFNKCNNLNTIVSKIKNPFSFDESAFCVYSSCKLFVPENTKSAYLSKTGWKKFANITDVPTRRSIHVATAGTLPNLISEEEKYQIEELTLTGKLNGTDLRFIREMAGVIAVGELDFDHDYVVKLDFTGGILVSLNLEGSIIVAGGEKYTLIQDYKWGECYTRLNCMPEYFLSDTKIKEIIIPNSVTSIDANAFYNSKNLISVTIPNSVTSIGHSAFSGCSSLTSITVDRENSKYDSRNSCNAIIETSSNTLTHGCKSTIIPNSVKTVGEYAFYGCSDLRSITIPNSVTSIGWAAFEYCTGLTSITIPNSVTSIAQAAFYGCTGLTSITIPNSITSIPQAAFNGCTGLKTITIPQNVTSIEHSAFRDCNSLTSVISEIENPFDIDNYVFEGISANAVLIVPKGTKTAYQRKKGWNVFSNIFSGEIGDVFEVNGITYEILENNTVTAKSGKNASGHVTIPNQVSFYGTTYNVTSISSGAFSYCDNIVAITIPNSVTSIGSYAFRNCSNLVSAIIGSGVTSIGSNAFYNTTLAKTIWLTNTLPSGYSTALGTVNYVSNDQFNISNKVVYKFLSSYFEVDGIRYVPVSPSDHTCDAIDCVYDESAENINIGETVTYKNITLTVMNVNPFTCYQNKYIKDANVSLVGKIGKYAFYGCTGLKTAAIKNQGSVGDYAFSSCSAMETAELGQKVTSIGTSSFTCCSKLKSIIIPDAVNSVGSSAFTGCEAMTSAKIGNGFETINEYTFSACSSLKVLEIGSSVKTINKYAFSGCSSLPTITIPKTVTKIDNSVFNSCNSLAKIIIADSENTLTLGSNRKGSYDYGDPLFSSCPLDSVYIGRDISYSTSSSYGYSPFYRNTSLRAVKITNKETEISENEFYGCTNLQKVIIGDGVNTIGKWAFSGCQSLKFFAFGTQVANIGQNAFSDCTALIEITSQAITPPECGSQALDDINKWNCKLYVPDGCLDAYQNAEQWKEFFYIEEGEGTIVIDDGQGDANDDGKVDKYDIDAIVEYIMTGDLNSINFKNADVNKDGKVNVADVTMLISIINMNNLSN